MGLAIKIQSSIERREFRDYAEVACLGHVTRARMTQIMNLLNLAPDLQEAILFEAANAAKRGFSHECDVREICREVSWAEQGRLWPQRGCSTGPISSVRSVKLGATVSEFSGS
jgi:hypothetical protein